jgi:hypothetical protein
MKKRHMGINQGFVVVGWGSDSVKNSAGVNKSAGVNNGWW